MSTKTDCVIVYLTEINYKDLTRDQRLTQHEISDKLGVSVGIVNSAVKKYRKRNMKNEYSPKKTEYSVRPEVTKVITKTKKITSAEIEDFAERITEESLHYKKARKLLKRITHKYGTDGIARDAFVVNYTLMVVNYILAGKLPEEV